ncbi:hypothetical protein Tco_1384471 [Tanacetum coccineum]
MGTRMGPDIEIGSPRVLRHDEDVFVVSLITAAGEKSVDANKDIVVEYDAIEKEAANTLVLMSNNAYKELKPQIRFRRCVYGFGPTM